MPGVGCPHNSYSRRRRRQVKRKESMRAAVFHESNAPLQIENVPIPELSAGEILVKVAACGLCHTDLHYIDHGVPTVKHPPLILGHEATGIVTLTAPGVTNVKEGDRVLLPAILTCGQCAACRVGRENICQHMRMFGNDVDGAYAEYVKAPAKDVFILPEEIPLVEGCIIADAVTTPYHAVKNCAEVRPGDHVVVYGCGGVGLNVVQFANLAGGIVIAVDVSDEKLEWARRFGASFTLNPLQIKGEVARAVRKLTVWRCRYRYRSHWQSQTLYRLLSVPCILAAGWLSSVIPNTKLPSVLDALCIVKWRYVAVLAAVR